MKNKKELNDFEQFLALGAVKPIAQETVWHKKIPKSPIQSDNRQHKEKIDTAFYFSDTYQPLIKYDPVRYLQEGADPNELKKLSRGFYDPDFFLDLHGLTQKEAKQEIAALINACLKEHVACASIMYGHGKHILKMQTPLWLAQHPKIRAFHQAPKTWGGDAAVLVLFENDLVLRR